MSLAVRRARRLLLGALVAALMLAVTAAALAAVVSVRVDGASMRPTLRDGDRAVVDPFAGPPRRLDVVVAGFDDGGPPVVKRVIGLAGDRVVVEGASVLVLTAGGTGWQRVDNPAWRDQWIRAGNPVDTVVPEGAVFLLGDNPDASEDSRQLGPAPQRLVRGPVAWRVYPLSALGRPQARVTLRPADPPRS